MPRTVLFDQLHINISAPGRLPEREVRALRRTLNQPRFRRQFLTTIRKFFQGFPALASTRISLTF